MIDKFAPPQVFIRRHTASPICDVVVLVRGQEMVLHCPSYSQALKWARLECKSYKIPQPDIEPLISEPEIEPLSRSPGTTEWRFAHRPQDHAIISSSTQSTVAAKCLSVSLPPGVKAELRRHATMDE